jgi:RNA polymerase sigma factor (sigma-70 family)
MVDESTGQSTHPSLLLRLRQPEDQDAWNLFVSVYAPLIFGHCRRAGLPRADAEDVTQEVFARLSTAIRHFEYQPDLGRFRTWLGTVVRNEILRYRKKSARQPAGVGGEGITAVLDQAVAKQEDNSWVAEFNAHVLQTALARCRPRFEAATWRAFEMVWLENRPPADVAREVGREIAWVYVAKSRVLMQLSQEVRELADDTIFAAVSER